MKKTLLLIMIECCLAEKKRLTQWADSCDKPNQALIDGLKACQQHFQTIAQDPLWNSLSAPTRLDVSSHAQLLSKLSSRMSRLPVTQQETKITYQIPCQDDLMAMNFFFAGSEDNQMLRLKKISTVLKRELTPALLTETGEKITPNHLDRLPWQMVFQAIRKNNKTLAKAAFQAIPAENLLLRALLQVHSQHYLLTLMMTSAKLAFDEVEEFDQDVVCGHLTFEILLKDVMTTLEQRRDMNFSFGLPTHHAGRNKAAGFCLINKVAIVIAYEQLTQSKALKTIILGTDVNRDDGLNDIVMSKKFDHAILHIDIYDSRVYPWPIFDEINEHSKVMGRQQGSQVVWRKDNKTYISIDLVDHLRTRAQVHPALSIALIHLKEALEEAHQQQDKVLICLPTGWDSHCQEMASCGREINKERKLSAKERKFCRFNDDDLLYFNQQIMELIHDYQSTILRVYWQLEGGYTDEVNARQIVNLTKIVQQHSEINSAAYELLGLAGI